MKSSLYTVIEDLCAARDISVTTMCSEIGIRRSVLSDLKHGRSNSLSMKTIWGIAQFFGVSTDVFFKAAGNTAGTTSTPTA